MASSTAWRGALGAEWAEWSHVMDLALGPFGEAAMAGLGGLKGKTIVDLGCGGGDTSFRLAKAAGPKGVVIGLDISADLIALAAEERARRGAERVAFLRGDAAEARLGAPADALYSRFGAMFFEQPVDAFARLRAQLRPGAKFSVVCWRGLKENDWAFAPLVAATPHLPAFDAPPPGAPGPFAWAKPEAFTRVLSRSGWRKIRFEPVDHEIVMGQGLPGFEDDPLEAATEFACAIGPTSGRISAAPAAARRKARSAVKETLATRMTGGAVRAPGACWLVRAKA